MTFAPPSRHNIGRAFYLVAAFHTARSGHHHNVIATDFDIANPDNRALPPERPAGQLVRRDDAVNFLDAFEHFEHGRIELRGTPNSAKDSVDYPRGAMYVKTVFDQPVYYALDLIRRRFLLHDN